MLLVYFSLSTKCQVITCGAGLLYSAGHNWISPSSSKRGWAWAQQKRALKKVNRWTAISPENHNVHHLVPFLSLTMKRWFLQVILQNYVQPREHPTDCDMVWPKYLAGPSSKMTITQKCECYTRTRMKKVAYAPYGVISVIPYSYATPCKYLHLSHRWSRVRRTSCRRILTHARTHASLLSALAHGVMISRYRGPTLFLLLSYARRCMADRGTKTRLRVGFKKQFFALPSRSGAAAAAALFLSFHSSPSQGCTRASYWWKYIPLSVRQVLLRNMPLYIFRGLEFEERTP